MLRAITMLTLFIIADIFRRDMGVKFGARVTISKLHRFKAITGTNF